MKTIVPFSNYFCRLYFFCAALLITSVSFAQVIPELEFKNPVLESGVAGADGAQYRFSNVAPGMDAIIEITGRSSGLVTLSSIDTSGPGLGYIKAFQPVLGIEGTAPANTTWSMDFKLTFCKAGTSIQVSIDQFYVTGIDIDGDGVALSEWANMNKLSTIDSAYINSLTFTWLSGWAQNNDFKIEGIVANAPGIDTNATNVMATYRYHNKDHINFSIGARTYAQTTTAGMRLNSLWFREFFNPALPVKLISFTSLLSNNKVDLKWVTATEINTSHFIVEKSYDGIEFTEAGLVFAEGNSTAQITYHFTDDLAGNKQPIIYYRLQTVDLDGKFDYSATRIIRTAKQTENTVSILTYPNPVTSELRITIPNSWQGKKVTYELLNANAQVTKKTEAGSGSQTEAMNVSSLAPGLYVVKVSCGTETATQKIIKR
ncbi:MAG: T9SS type A sorting domain-containing protein [Chitinophagaceae bacterium]|nr:T9SS type A sorting domain-containing protein [Chitinophagaceae bacterium]